MLATLSPEAVYDALKVVQITQRIHSDLLATESFDGYPTFKAPVFTKLVITEEAVEAGLMVSEDWGGETLREEQGIYLDFFATRGLVRVWGVAHSLGPSGPVDAAARLARKVIEQTTALRDFVIIEMVEAHDIMPGQSVIDFGSQRQVAQTRTFFSEDDNKTLTELTFVGGGGFIFAARTQVERVVPV